MSEITVTLTEQQEKFLKMFATNHHPGAEDNVCTHKPIHVVQTRRERVTHPDYGCGDIVKYYLPDLAEDYESAEEMIRAYWDYYGDECPIPIVSFKEAYDAKEFIDINGDEQVIFDEQKYIEAYGIPEDKYQKEDIEYYYEPVAYFFILSEAKRYMEYQGHNLCHPRTYTYGPGYANSGEYESFWNLLYSIGVKLNNNSGELMP